VCVRLQRGSLWSSFPYSCRRQRPHPPGFEGEAQKAMAAQPRTAAVRQLPAASPFASPMVSRAGSAFSPVRGSPGGARGASGLHAGSVASPSQHTSGGATPPPPASSRYISSRLSPLAVVRRYAIEDHSAAGPRARGRAEAHTPSSGCRYGQCNQLSVHLSPELLDAH
jgi:hypothetical protein